MDIVSQCRLRVGSVAWQSMAEAWTLTVVCKATYRLLPNESPLADDQEDIYEDDTHWDDDASRSLAVASDLAPFKPAADVLVVGHAFAPQGQPARALTARVNVGEVDKSIEVWCDRGFSHTGQLLEGPRFTKMRLRYERAAGGPGTWNPAGMRFDAPPNAYGMVAIPNLQPPGRLVAWRGDTFEPIGFGPVAPAWLLRRDLLHKHAAGWPYRRWYERPLPDDINPAFFNAAPPDQRLAALKPNERIVLEGLHPSLPRLATRLAEVRPRAAVERAGQGREDVALTCDTLLIDTDRSLCTLVWRGRVGLRSRDEPGRVIVTLEEAAPQRAALSDDDDDDERFMTAALPQSGAPLQGGRFPPFLAKASLPAQAPAPPPAEELAEEDIKDVDDDREAAWMTLVPTPQQAAFAALRPATPFVPPGSPGVAPPLSSPPPLEPPSTPTGRSGKTLLVPSPQGAPNDLLPFKSAAGAPPIEMPSAGDSAALEQPAAPMPGLPAPPPMIGPLAREELDHRPAPEPAAAPEPEPAPAAEAAADPEAAPEPAPAKRNPADFSIEKCATLTASINRTPANEAKILYENDLERPDWDAIQAYWLEEIRKETQRGRRELLQRFDAAYVDQLELERGPIEVDEYARLTVADERGVLHEALAELSLPAGAAMRIERLWLQKTVKDAAFGDRVSEAVERARLQ